MLQIVFLVVAHTVPLAGSRHILQFCYKLRCAKIGIFTVKAIVRAAHVAGHCGLFPQRTLIGFCYNEIAVICISLFAQFNAPPFAEIIPRRHYTKKPPLKGEVVADCRFLA
jgi:hypothetical protein